MVKWGSLANLTNNITGAAASAANAARRAFSVSQTALTSLNTFGKRAAGAVADSMDDINRLVNKADDYVDDLAGVADDFAGHRPPKSNLFDGTPSFEDNFLTSYRKNKNPNFQSTPNLVDAGQMDNIANGMKNSYSVNDLSVSIKKPATASLVDLSDAPNPALRRSRPPSVANTVPSLEDMSDIAPNGWKKNPIYEPLDADGLFRPVDDLPDTTQPVLKKPPPKLQVDTAPGGPVGRRPQTSAYDALDSGLPSGKRPPGSVIDADLLDGVDNATKKPRTMRPGKTATALAALASAGTAVANAVQIGQGLAALANSNANGDDDDDNNNITIINNGGGDNKDDDDEEDDKPPADDKPKDPAPPNQTDFRPVYITPEQDVPLGDDEEDLPYDARRISTRRRV